MGRKEFKNMKSKMKGKRKTKDVDQIQEDMKPENMTKLQNQEPDLDVAGSAQHYCLHCARYFIDNKALEEHCRGKIHKRRVKSLETEAYSQEEADRAAGMGSYVAPKKRKISTQNKNSVMDESDDVSLTKKKK